MVKTDADVFATPVSRSRSTVEVSKPPRSLTVLTVKGSVVGTRLVTFVARARPPGPGVGRLVKISGRVGTIVILLLITVPLLLITTGYDVPSFVLLRNGGTTNVIPLGPTCFSPTAN